MFKASARCEAALASAAVSLAGSFFVLSSFATAFAAAARCKAALLSTAVGFFVPFFAAALSHGEKWGRAVGLGSGAQSLTVQSCGSLFMLHQEKGQTHWAAKQESFNEAAKQRMGQRRRMVQ